MESYLACVTYSLGQISDSVESLIFILQPSNKEYVEYIKLERARKQAANHLSIQITGTRRG